MQPEFLRELTIACKHTGLHTALDTCGHCDPAVFSDAVKEVDLVLFDVKIIDPVKHEQWTGTSNEVIHQNLQELDNSGKPFVVRIPLIPGVNDDMADVEVLIRYLRAFASGTREVHLLPYHRMGRHKLKRLGLEDPMGDWPEPGPETVKHTALVLEKAGFTVKTGG
jgi:pyruvate formate lyase activating enzyme